MSKRLISTLLVLCCAMPVAAPASAATAVGALAVSATVLAFCAVSSTPLAFGNYSSAQLDSTATVLVTCSNGTTYNVGLDAGAGTGASTTTRKLTGPSSATFNYTMYRDSGHTTNWGNTVGTDTASGTGNGLVQTLTVYGRIPGGQYPGTGAYVDTVVVTVTY